MSGTGTSQKLFRLAATRSHKDLGLRYEDESQVCNSEHLLGFRDIPQFM